MDITIEQGKIWWESEGPNHVILKQSEDRVIGKASIKWRSEKIHIKLDITHGKRGYYGTWSFVYRGVIYQIRRTISRWGISNPREEPPKLKTKTRELKIEIIEGNIHFTNLILNDDLINEENTESPFATIETPDNIEFERPPIIFIRSKQLDVTLFEEHIGSLFISCYAYFEKERLIIDYGKMSAFYEEEKYLVIPERALEKLYLIFEIQDKNKYELLIGLHNSFKGEKCFERAKLFFNQRGIYYSNHLKD